MTRQEIHSLLDEIADRSPLPIKSFQVQDWDTMGELQVSVTFQKDRKPNEGTK